MTNITLYTSTRQCSADNYFLGYEGENKINKLIFKFDDGFRDGLGILNIQRGEEKGYLDLEKVGNTYELEVKSALLTKKGEITFQLSINESDGTVIKYDTFQMVVKDSIDTDTEMPEDYPNWVDMANAKLVEVDQAIENAEHATENATKVAEELVDARENGEFNGKNGFSPSAKVTQTEEGAKIEITDENGTTTAVVKHGQGGGEGGGTGADGFSPIANVTQTEEGAEIVITDKKGTTTAKIYNGKDGADGNDGSDGLTPHIGNNGNWWIGETDTGVKAEGSGSGGLAELPIATSEVLGGIKVGEGLEITEDGILSALGGSGGVGSETVLWEGNAITNGATITFNESLENFDYILIGNGYRNVSGAERNRAMSTFRVKDIVDYGYGTTKEHQLNCGGIIPTNTIYALVTCNFISATELKLNFSNTNEMSPYVNYVIGIKLGSSGGSSYKEVDLISEPVEYTLANGTQTTINQDLVFSDNVSNYDEVVFVIDVYNVENKGYYCRKDISMLVSEITYSGSDSAGKDGDSFYLDINYYNTSTNITNWYQMGVHWKNETTLRVRNTLGNSLSYTKFRIKAVKGIKY